MIKLTVKQLAAIKELASTRSFTVAAARLHTTQSNLSTTIQEAESLLGVRLFDRTTKAVDLTDVGREFAQGVTRLLDELEVHVDNAQAVGRLAKGHLAIGATPLLGSTIMPAVLARFHSMHPEITLRLDDDQPAALLALLARRDNELAIGTFEGKASEVKLEHLFTDELVVLSHPAAGLGASVSWAELSTLPMVSILSTSTVGQLVDDTLRSLQQSRPRPIIQSHHWLTVIALTRSLQAACIVPHYALELQQAQGLKVSRLWRPKVERRIQVASLKSRELSVAAQRFVALLKETCASAAPASRRRRSSD